jgi:ATP-binding cassette subfamily B protein
LPRARRWRCRYAVKLLVDGGLARPASDLAERLASIRAYFLLLFGVAVVLGLATAARFYMVSWIGERVTTDLRQAVYAHVLRQSPQFFETLKTGEVLSRLTTDTTVIHTPSVRASAWACATSSCSPAG